MITIKKRQLFSFRLTDHKIRKPIFHDQGIDHLKVQMAHLERQIEMFRGNHSIRRNLDAGSLIQDKSETKTPAFKPGPDPDPPKYPQCFLFQR